MEGAHSILLSITGGRDLSLWEINEAAKAVSEAAHPEANIIFGAMVDETLEDQVWVTVVATRYSGETRAAPRSRSRPASRASRAPAARPCGARTPAGRSRTTATRAIATSARPAERDDYRPAASREPEPAPAPARRGGLGVTELDVPEFMPRRF